MHDLVIRGGRIVDGTGGPAFNGDVAVKDGVLVQVGGKAGAAHRSVDADGLVVTPGFLDIHTHYDGQVHWDPFLTPSSWHGVTTVLAGNCGVGFAPVRTDAREWLIGLMSGIEEIPADSLREGMPWLWETYPEFQDVLAGREYAIDIGTQIPHAAVRAYVMGERGTENAPATAEDLQQMGQLVQDGMRAGAFGLTGSRTLHHRSLAGKSAPGYGLAFSELIALGQAAASAGHGGVIGINLDYDDVQEEVRQLRALARGTGLKVWTLLNQFPYAPDKWSEVLAAYTEAAAAGEELYAQVAGRPISYLMGLTSSRNPFWEFPSYIAIQNRPLAERVAILRDPAFRERLFAEKVNYRSELTRVVAEGFDQMFKLGPQPDYEPAPQESIAAMAKRAGRRPQDVVLDAMLERDGHELIYLPFTNYVSGDASVVKKMLEHPRVVLGLGDAGAHASRICDSSIPTFMLTHWARDRQRGPRMTLEQAVHFQTGRTSSFYGLHDRGVLQEGKKADINLIDFDRLALVPPEMVHDQPAGAQRLVQRARGYVMTVVSGVVTAEQGQATGAMPGRLVRSQPHVH